MPASKVSAFPNYTTPLAGDIILIVDVANGVTKGIQVSNLFKVPAGTASVPSMNLAAGTLETTPSDGDIEADANCFYGCTDAGNRGVIPLVHIIRQHADRAAFTSNTVQQPLFDGVTNGTITLETGTYFFEGIIQMKAMSATSGNLKFSLIGAGSATLANILYLAGGMDAAVNTTTAWSGEAQIVATQTATDLATASTGTVMTFFVKGSFECTVAGTLIPSAALTTASAAVTTAGSFFMLNRVGATTVTSVGQWT